MRTALPFLLLATLGLAACDGGGDPVEQALRETAAANHAARLPEESVSVKPAGSADEAWVAAAIQQNRQAIASAGQVLAATDDPAVRKMAQAAIDARTREINDLQAWTPAARPAA
ncbi:DUF305 domain-containing protein [Brevundimonas lenta]|uniref:Uncharacterized protein (DUF305 family) n=1 Tax=Brevundimonas lenta TaxID=424796 RepID=A0A7W6JEV9_9CAUL|nr:DUF305 domain-containing protein [Brevundimonas lenta]MBB4083843.1 uncharacterized protein (DUF305 family) [Brevundimonas lenta]